MWRKRVLPGRDHAGRRETPGDAAQEVPLLMLEKAASTVAG
jgi:hypothetical protein